MQRSAGGWNAVHRPTVKKFFVIESLERVFDWLVGVSNVFRRVLGLGSCSTSFCKSMEDNLVLDKTQVAFLNSTAKVGTGPRALHVVRYNYYS